MVRGPGKPLGDLIQTSECGPFSLRSSSWVRRVHPNAARQRGNAARSQNRAATDGQAVEFVRMFADGNHSVSARNRAREAPPPAAAIKVAYSNRVSPWTLRPRHRRPMKVRDTLRSNCDASAPPHCDLPWPTLAFSRTLQNSVRGWLRTLRCSQLPVCARRSTASTSRKRLGENPTGFHVKVRCGSRADLRLPARC